MSGRLGIIAGGGSLPRLIINACKQIGRDFFVIAIKEQAKDGAFEGTPHAWVRLGAATKILKLLNEATVKELVMVGHISRPSLASLRPDAKAMELFVRLGSNMLGDDNILRAIISILEEEGFIVISPSVILKNLQVEPGNLGVIKLDGKAKQDVSRGIEVLKIMSPADVGQAIVIQEGFVLGIEAAEGTDSLIERCGSLKREGPGPILIKARKVGQDTRVDLPTIGLATIEKVINQGFRGLVIEADATLVLDKDRLIETADKAGLFVSALNVKN